MAIFYFILKNGNGKLGFDFLLSLFKTIFHFFSLFPPPLPAPAHPSLSLSFLFFLLPIISSLSLRCHHFCIPVFCIILYTPYTRDSEIIWDALNTLWTRPRSRLVRWDFCTKDDRWINRDNAQVLHDFPGGKNAFRLSKKRKATDADRSLDFQSISSISRESLSWLWMLRNF